MVYMTKDVCCQKITVEVEDGVIKDVNFDRGCNGNLKGLAALAVGKTPHDVIASLEGIDCNSRGTSCPDQLAKALKQLVN
ncbi:MAG: TIGR03905 family TSCPD domain-containing protein [Defluviitaleaceae bacterium]|nr:TIGR03905 family TSCPD domain-containing protein [Defluviitaleaceae bacterium]